MVKNLFFIIIIYFSLLNFSFSMNLESHGVQFNCQNKQEKRNLISQLNKEFQSYQLENDIYIVQHENIVQFYMLPNNKDTTKIKNDFKLSNDTIYLPTLKKYLSIVSKKEILIALSYPDRLTTIPSCHIKELKEHIGIRQNIVLWSTELNWQWPDGEEAYWNKKLWRSGTPIYLHNTYEALYDAFLHQKKYAIGCYTATKMVYVFAILDYYKRVSPNKHKFNTVLYILIQDKDPLVSIEPGMMWNFEDTFNPETDNTEGKLLTLSQNISATSFIPGDWIYILNTNKETYQKTGYEGSNAIYLGGNKFDDYYNDHQHFYTFEEKLNEVYQWRNKVFSRSADADKIENISYEKIQSLKKSPKNNGLLLTTRIIPKFFN